MARDLLELFLRDLNRLYQTQRMYPPGHEQIASAAQLASRSLEEWGRPVRMSFVGEDLIVEDRSAHDFGDRLKGLVVAFRACGWEGIRLEEECSPRALLEWLETARRGEVGPYAAGGVYAGRLGADPSRGGRGGVVPWPEGYADYGPDVRVALAQVGEAKPEGIELARGVVGNIFLRVDSGESLLATARKLKEFDEYTFTHALNVAILSMAMARARAATPKTVELVALAALFHDVGKERLPVELLNKPGDFSPEERELMNRHPVEGASMLLALQDEVHPLLPTVAYQHHLGADLGGYPATRRKTLVHPASHVVAVADVFDAMRTLRPYGGPFSEEHAVTTILRKLRRGALEEAAVAALLKVLGALEEGRRVELADGRLGTVVAPGERDPLRPLVRGDDGALLDLADPCSPHVAALPEVAPPAP